MRSGVIAAALMTTKGPLARPDIMVQRARGQLLAATRRTDNQDTAVGLGGAFDRLPRLDSDDECPTSVLETGDNCLSSRTSRLSRDVSSARVQPATERSALNGFSIKS